MKPREWIGPVAAIIAAACLLVPQSRVLSSLRQRTAMLGEQVAVVRKDSQSDVSGEMSLATRIRTSGKTSINWNRIAELTGEGGGDGIFARQELLRTKARMDAMTPAGLLAALEEVRGLGFDVRSRGEIDGLLIAALMKKDLRAAADYLVIPENNHIGLSGNFMRDTIDEWSKTDFASTLAWFDGKVAEGVFVNKSLGGRDHRRFGIEAVLLTKLVMSDPGAAANRLKTYPENQRSYIFDRITSNNRRADTPPDENELASRVALARETLPPAQQAAVVSNSVTPFSRTGDYQKIDSFLNHAAASPDERTAAVITTGRERFVALVKDDKLTVGEVDRFREWAARQSPEKVDRFTGSTLAGLLTDRGNGFDPTAKVNELLFHYHEVAGNDEVMLGFLGSWRFWGDAAKARALAEKIHDPSRRDEFLKTLEPAPGTP